MNTPFPPECAAKFRCEKLLATGGFGAVYLATQVALDRPVVVKLLHGAHLSDARVVTRFVSEAQVTAQLRHPHIVVCLDHGMENGVPWIAYEYLEGQDLRGVLERAPLTPADAVETVAQICSALGEAHRHGILHRDVKPENVIRLANRIHKVTDFGIALWTNAAIKTQTGLIVGTPAYVAPEVIAGEPASAASEVYAAGTVLFELITGRRPFQETNVMALLAQQMHGTPPRLATVQPDVSRELDALVARALEKKPGDRFASANAMAEALRQLQAERPPLGKTKPRSQPAAVPRSRSPGNRGGRRRRAAWIAGGVAGAALVLALFGARRHESPDPPDGTASARASLPASARAPLPASALAPLPPSPTAEEETQAAAGLAKARVLRQARRNREPAMSAGLQDTANPGTDEDPILANGDKYGPDLARERDEIFAILAKLRPLVRSVSERTGWWQPGKLAVERLLLESAMRQLQLDSFKSARAYWKTHRNETGQLTSLGDWHIHYLPGPAEEAAVTELVEAVAEMLDRASLAGPPAACDIGSLLEDLYVVGGLTAISPAAKPTLERLARKLSHGSRAAAIELAASATWKLATTAAKNPVQFAEWERATAPVAREFPCAEQGFKRARDTIRPFFVKSSPAN